jgi:hypothetical protein
MACGYLIREQDIERDNPYITQEGEIFADFPGAQNGSFRFVSPQ